MTVFELLNIKPGDAIKVDDPWSDSGPRFMVPLSMSKNGISIRAIDTRYGNIRYVKANWDLFATDDGVRNYNSFVFSISFRSSTPSK